MFENFNEIQDIFSKYLAISIPIIIVVLLYGKSQWRRVINRRRLKHGISCSARILSSQIRGNGQVSGPEPVFELSIQAEVTCPDRSPYRASITTLAPAYQVSRLQPGVMVQVRVDAVNPYKIVLDSVSPEASYSVPVFKYFSGSIISFGIIAFIVIVAFMDISGIGLSDVPDLNTVCGKAMACCQELAANSEHADSARCMNFAKFGNSNEFCQSFLDSYRKGGCTVGDEL